MNQKALLCGVAALLAVAIGALLLSDSDDVTGPQQAPIEANATDGEPATAAAAAAAPATVEATAQATEAAAARDAVAEATSKRPIPDGSIWITLTVVDAADDSPVPGADVFWYDEKAWEAMMPARSRSWGWDPETQQLWRTPEKIADRVGWQTRTDDKGQARVALRENSTVAALRGGKYGRLELRKNTVTPVGGHQLRLTDDRSLQVRVLDDADQPCARVPINVLPYDKQNKEMGNFRWATLATTDADGMATVPHLQVLQKQAKDEELDLAQTNWHVRPVMPGDDQRGVAIAFDALPSEPVVLRLGPCGSIKVKATNQGRPLASFQRAVLQEDRSGKNEENNWTMPRMVKVDADGWARFPLVPIGRRYHLMDGMGAGLRTTTAGPLARGQEVEVELRVADDTMTLLGRLVDEQRQPVANQLFQVHARGPSIRHWGECHTDAEGRFLIALGNPRKDNKLDEMTFQLQIDSGQQPLRAELSPRTLRGGIEDVGDLVLGEGTLLAAGRLVAGDAAYTKEIHVDVQYQEIPTGNRQPRWRSIENTMVHVDGKGGFKVSGKPQNGRHRLSLHPHEALPIEPFEFQVGTKDLVVMVDPGAQLAASVLLPERIDTDTLSAMLVPAKPPEPDGKRKGRNLTGNLTNNNDGARHDLQWPAVPLGTYALELRLRTRTAPLLRIEGVEAPGPEGGDPRLVDIDLRDLVRKLTLRLLDAEGKPLDDADGMLFAGGQAEGAEWIGQQFWSSTFEVLVPPGPLDLLLCCRGHRPQPVRAVPTGDKLDVRLDPWPTIEVFVPNIPQLPKGASVQVTLEPIAGPGGKIQNQWGSNDRAEYMAAYGSESLRDGRCKVAIGDGPYKLTLRLQANRRSHDLEGIAPAQVLATDARVTVQVPEEQWKQAIATITPPPK